MNATVNGAEELQKDLIKQLHRQARYERRNGYPSKMIQKEIDVLKNMFQVKEPTVWIEIDEKDDQMIYLHVRQGSVHIYNDDLMDAYERYFNK